MTNNSKLNQILAELQNLNHILQNTATATDKNSADVVLYRELQTELTNKNILLIAESLTELTRRVNTAIPLLDKSVAYEIKIDYLTERVKKLEADITELKTRTA